MQGERPAFTGGLPETPVISPLGRAHLNLLRGGAALTVLLAHTIQLRGRPTVLGHVAVVAFFVLSGFLVATSTLEQPGWRRYAAARASRILTVYWPALALGGALDLVGARIVRAPIYFGAHPAGWLAHVTLTPSAVLVNLAFLQSLRGPVLGTNAPLWTLAYEVWFYVAFPFLALLVTGRRWTPRLFALAALFFVVTIAGRYVLATMSVWLLGVVVACARRRAPRDAGIYLAIAVALVGATLDDPVFLRALLRDLALGAFFALTVAFLATRAGAASAAYERVARALADVSYSLYLVHVPALVLLIALGFGLLAPALALLYAVLVWFVFERRTNAVRRWLTGRA